MIDKIKAWLDANVWDGEDRTGCNTDWVKHDPDDLLELVVDCFQDIGSKWISADTPPDSEQGILMVTNKGRIYSGRGSVFNKSIAPRDAGNGYVSDYYTHWMPLPKAPSNDHS